MKRVILYVRALVVCMCLMLGMDMMAQNNEFVLNGKIDSSFNDQFIMLFTFKDNSILSVDTTVVGNGTFHFEGKEYLDEFSMLSIGNYPDTVMYAELVLEKGTIDISMDSISIATGTPLNDLYKSYRSNVGQLSKVIWQLEKEQGDRFLRPGSPYQKAYSELNDYRVNFKKNNATNVVGKYVILDELWGVITSDSAFQVIYEALDDKMKQHPGILSNIKDRIKEKKRIAQLSAMIGKPYIDFELQTPEGEMKRLSDYVGQSDYLLIDFWASWCGPCIADIPYLKAAYQKYKDRGLMILSVSLDARKNAWLKAIERVDVPWDHLSDLKGGAELQKAYQFSGIPYAILVDREGKILMPNLRGEILDYAMEYLLTKDAK